MRVCSASVELSLPLCKHELYFSAQRQGFGQHVVSSQDQNGTFEVFNENQLSNQPSDHPRLTDGQWSTLPATSAKENEIKPGQWNSLGVCISMK